MKRTLSRLAMLCLVCALASCAAAEDTDTLAQPSAKPSVAPSKSARPYTILTDEERRFATREIWEDPAFGHMRPAMVQEAQTPRIHKPLSQPEQAVVDDGFDAAWSETKQQLLEQGMKEDQVQRERADFKEAYFAD